jgi:hypothetical protein
MRMDTVLVPLDHRRRLDEPLPEEVSHQRVIPPLKLIYFMDLIWATQSEHPDVIFPIFSHGTVNLDLQDFRGGLPALPIARLVELSIRGTRKGGRPGRSALRAVPASAALPNPWARIAKGIPSYGFAREINS